MSPPHPACRKPGAGQSLHTLGEPRYPPSQGCLFFLQLAASLGHRDVDLGTPGSLHPLSSLGILEPLTFTSVPKPLYQSVLPKLTSCVLPACINL